MRKAIRVSEDIALNVINEVTLFYFEVALLPALFWGKCVFGRKNHVLHIYGFPALRVRHPETRLTVYWGLP